MASYAQDVKNELARKLDADTILDHTGQGAIDYVLVNSTPIPAEMWQGTGSTPVEIDENKVNAMGMGLIKADLMSATQVGRHDPDKLCAAVMKIIYDLGTRD